MTRDKKDKIGKEQLLLEASRLGRLDELEAILGQSQPYRLKKKTNPLASLRKPFGPNSARDPATGFTCLHHAALNGHSECVKLILFYGAKLNAVDYKGSSALHLSAWAGNLDVVQILLAHNVALSNEQQRQDNNATADSAHSDSNANSAQLMGDNWRTCLFRNQEPLEIDLCNNDNQTPLSLAAQFGHNQVVQELIRHGANVHIRNNQLESPLDLACLSGRLETVRLLLDSSLELQADLRRPHSAIPIGESGAAPGSTRSPVHNQQALLQRTQSLQVAGDSPTNSNSTSTKPSGWVSLLRRNSHATTTTSNESSGRRGSGGSTGGAKKDAASPVVEQQESAASQSISERGLKLLAHSPLHYATRRGHHHLVSMLLYSYKANILQVSSLGGVLHEIALNNGKHLDLIGVFFQFIATRFGETSLSTTTAQPTGDFNNNPPPASNRTINNSISCLPEMVDKFLELKNEQGQTVFQLLAQINNRSAHETRELIYRFSDQLLKHHQNKPTSTSSATIAQQQQQYNHQLMYDLMKQQQGNNNTIKTINNQDQQLSANANPTNQENSVQYFSSQNLHQRSASHNPTSNGNNKVGHQQQFSDMKQINSFVTMKRVPKASSSSQQQQRGATRGGAGLPLMDLTNTMLTNQFTNQVSKNNYQPLMMNQSGSLDNATNEQMFNNCNPTQSLYETQTIDRRANNHHQMQLTSFQQPGLGQYPQQQQPYAHQLQQQPHPTTMSLMTRSVSNLTNWAPHEPNQSFNDNNYNNQQQQYFAQQQQQLQAMLMNQGKMVSSNATTVSAANRQYRSRSRDLGSLLQEAKRQQQLQQQQSMDEQQQQQARQQLFGSQQQQQTNQLVRSQTDCSHLMNRFLGDHRQQQQAAAAFAAGVSAENNNNNDMLTMMGHDRKTINRHYHVIENQFYPPRLMGDNQNQLLADAHGNQMSHSQQQLPTTTTALRKQQPIAVIPPISRDNQLRSSARSALLTSQIVSVDPTKPNAAPAASNQGSRLSLNMERPSMSDNDQNSVSKRVQVGQMPRQDLIELQRRIQAEQQQQQQANLLAQVDHQQDHAVAMHGSLSLESHLNDNCSSQQQFDATRRAIMNDFDQLIGQELLNRNHGLIIGNHSGSSSKASLSEQPAPGKQHQCITGSSSNSSILTGVTLDMDKSGSQLTVSGTRISFAQTTSPSDNTHQQQQQPRSSSHDEQLSINHQDLKQSSSPSCETESCNMMQQQQSTQKIAPAKPPRPSTMILADRYGYGEPGVTGNRLSLTRAPSVKPPPPPVPPQPAARTSQRLSRQLHVDAPSTQQKQQDDISAPDKQQMLGSATSSSSSSDVATSGLLKMTTDGSSRHLTTSELKPSRMMDQDSGVCTSNSPASLSHESDKSTDLYQDTPQLVCQDQPVQPRAPRAGPPRPNAICLPERAHQSASWNQNQSIASPPSPNTAQMCIEEALIPLAGNYPYVTNKPATARHSVASETSDLDRLVNGSSCVDTDNDSTSKRDHMIDWLVKASNANACEGTEQQHARGDEMSKCDPDYDNLQQSMMQSSSLQLIDGNTGADDADYAETSNENLSSSSQTDSRSSSNDSSSNENDTTLVVSSSESPVMRNMQKPCKKEIMLRVVIDDKDKCSTTDSVCGPDTFYIDAAELKKIVAGGKLVRTAPDGVTKVDAGTITDDDELSAAMDEPTGYIRFTLRKRRQESTSTNTDTEQPKDTQAKSTSAIVLQRKFVNHDAEASSNYDNGLNHQASMSSQAKKSRLASHLSFDQSKLHQQLLTDDQQRRHSEFSSSDIATAITHKTMLSSELSPWFAAKLPGLIDYESQFVAHGFDSLQFMNQPSLMNDHLLKSIGIDNESHRTLIMATINHDLPALDCAKLVGANCKQLQNDTIGQLLSLLKLDHLLNVREFADIWQATLLNTQAIDSLRCLAMEKLSLGHRIRLSVALDVLDSMRPAQVLVQQLFEERPKLSLLQQSSVDSTSSTATTTSSDLSSPKSGSSEAMEISQTSSSSDQSIKSVVSMKICTKDSERNIANAKCNSPADDLLDNRSQESTPTNAMDATINEDGSLLEAAEDVVVANEKKPEIAATSIAENDVSLKQETNDKPCDAIAETSTPPPAEPAEEEDSVQIKRPISNNIERASPPISQVILSKPVKSGGGSLVSQVARRIEEENARRLAGQAMPGKQVTATTKPVAATRKFTTTTALAKPIVPVQPAQTFKVEANSGVKPIVSNIVNKENISIKKQPSMTSGQPMVVAAAAPPVRRISGARQFPIQAHKQVTASSDLGITKSQQNDDEQQQRPKQISKLDEIRMSFERQIEENAAAKGQRLIGNQASIDRLPLRPKPPPPAKPANLIQVASKLA